MKTKKETSETHVRIKPSTKLKLKELNKRLNWKLETYGEIIEMLAKIFEAQTK